MNLQKLGTQFVDSLKHFRVKSIRAQLTIGIAAALVPCLVVGYNITSRYVRASIYDLTENMLTAEGELVSYGLRNWGEGIRFAVEAVASMPAFQEGRLPEIQSSLNELLLDDPSRQWRFWSAEERPKLLAYTGDLDTRAKLNAEQNQGSREYFKVALRGIPSYQVVVSRLTNRACLNVTQPVFNSSNRSEAGSIKSVSATSDAADVLDLPIRSDLAGILVLCIPLDDFGEDTGLDSLFKDEKLSLLNDRQLLHNHHRGDFLFNTPSLTSAVMLVSNSGQLLFPNVDKNQASVPTIEDLRRPKSPQLYAIATKAKNRIEVFDVITISGRKYFALTSNVDSAWSLVVLFSEEAATQAIRTTGQVQSIVGIITLLLVLAIVAIRARLISRPISNAGKALQSISLGNFDVNLEVPANPSDDDEVIGLLRNVQVSANRLKAYLTETTAFAVTQKQLDTAKAIQRDFLLQVLPTSPAYQAAVISRPALEIGADWYDMIDAGNYVVFVVADVCDKGVPSALYMSVFRSLIRSKLLEHLSDLDCSMNASEVITDAIVRTNDYMADNQNSSMMFATVLIAAVSKKDGRMSYLCAGHETPYVIRAGAIVPLDQVSGPAIGLFGGATYSVSEYNLRAGDRLVLYSDGLVDARSPSDQAFGHDRLEALLCSAHPGTASQLLDVLVASVDEHMNQADQFDDLTIMIFEWLGL